MCPITYEKKKAKEQRLNFNNFATMDTKSFNSKIGFITNLASNFIAMLSNFDPESREYKELEKRIDLLRFYQGSAIDATKGDVFIPPPKHWSKKQKYIKIEDDLSEEEKLEIIRKNKEIAFNNRIAGDKKAYFFGYIYPKYMEEYNRHKSNYKKMCKLIYSSSLYDLLKKENKTIEEKKFVQKYYYYIPLLINNCTMNILAMYVESIEFDNKWNKNIKEFDYHRLMSKDYIIDNEMLYNKIKNIVYEFNKKYNSIIREKKELTNSDDIILETDDIENYNEELSLLIQEYETKLLSLCSNTQIITDYLIDIYYKYFKSKSKSLLWGEFGEVILNNVKSKSEYVSYPILDDNGIEYLGKYYSLKVVKNNVNNIQ